MNYGKRLKLTFDSAVYHVTNAELARWALKNAYGEMIYPVAISYGATQNIVYLDFVDFNNIVEPATFECLGCVKMGSPDLPLDPFSVQMYLDGLYQIPSDYEYLLVSDVSAVGEIDIQFDGKMYADEYLQAGISTSGLNLLLQFYERYADEYLQMASVAAAGQYCDVNGIPV